ncbi:hypothetical protein [Pelistega ratti]
MNINDITRKDLVNAINAIDNKGLRNIPIASLTLIKQVLDMLLIQG